ncbi:hypothetical protein [uncultured Duncaniella sp.]|uniref:hypothetical protein n=1 Tax=uncultured Duncaniella sp. TaxID=2768039 RepID=UPI0025A67E17|nr:hypothetical protein [uncultured Duncaniella sp.]
MPRFLLMTLSMILLPFVLSRAMKRAVVVDSVSGRPLAKASVFGRSGKPVGISSDNGELPERIALSDYPLTVSSLGYAPATVEGPTDGLIKLREIAYDLPEVVVGPKKRQVLYMKGYVREYSMLTTYADTVFLFREKMVDFMIPARKTKGYYGWTTPRVLASKSYYHFSNDEGLDSVSNYFGQHFSWSDWVGVIDRAELPARLQGFDEAACDTVAGKYGPASIWRKDGENVSLDVDVLADTTGHGWAKSLAVYLRGKVDFSRFTLKYRFAEVNSGLILADNIAGLAINIESKGRGRDLPRFLHAGEEFDVDTYAEMYITDKEYMSVGQAKKFEKRDRRAEAVAIVSPDHAPELQPAIVELVGRVNSIDHARLRAVEKPDQRYVATKFPGYEKRKGSGLRNFFKSALNPKYK